MDPREPDEKMSGVPLTRTMSPDMRWVYTLYSGEENFVHALDTKAGTARGIDLPGGISPPSGSTLDGPTLQVGDVATIDLRTFALAEAPAATAATPRARTRQGRRRIPWLPVVGLVALAGRGCSSAACARTARSRSRSRVRHSRAGRRPA